jgi:hypothetical protein
MKTYKVTFTIRLNEDNTDWIESAIDEQLERGEEIIEGNIEEIKPTRKEEIATLNLWNT